MDEDKDLYKKLPTDEKCVHTLWKARLAGYEEAIKLFNQIDDEKSPEWNKYLGLVKKFVTDSNAVAQERGLEAALVFVENCGHAGKTTGEVMSGIVLKCIAAPKTKTRDLALQITLMYIEIEKPDIVQEELLKGTENKNPKVVSASISALTTALKQFGNKVVGIKPMVKKIPILLADRDKTVREEMKQLVIEMHRWIGPAIEPHIASLQPVVQQELRNGFTEQNASPQRYLRSQQDRMREVQHKNNDDGAAEEECIDHAGGDSPDLDPFDLYDPVEILSKVPKDFYSKVEATKWQERKEALDALEALLKGVARLEPGDYADLVRALKKIISKDKNVMIVALAGHILALIAAGLRNKFQPYAVACTESILEKFKEKKPNVVTSMREAIDAIYPSTNLEAIMEDMLAAFENKNPSVKAESAMFLARALSNTQPAAFNKKIMKAYVAGLLKMLESADPSVRDAAAEALGTAMKLVGEKNIAPHISSLDNLKEQKIKEAAEKAVINVKIAGAKKEVKAKAPVAKTDTKPTSAGSTQPKPVVKKAVAKKAAPLKKAPSKANVPVREQDLSPEEVDMKAEEMLTPDIIAGLADKNWKSRLSAVQAFQSIVQGLAEDTSAQLLFKILNKKPGLKDTNVQVMKARLECAKYIADNFTVTATSAEVIIQDLVTKLGEASIAVACCECLASLAVSVGLEYLSNEGLGFAMDQQKNPKVQAEMFNWLTQAVKDFGFTWNVKSLIPHIKKALSATNPNVRTSSINLIGVLSLYVGPSLINHFDGEKPATKQLIGLEIDKYANSTPPTPTRQVGSVPKAASKMSLNNEIEDEYMDANDEEPAPVEDNRPITDIAPMITDTLLAEINDKNWKVRNEALEKLRTIITTSAPIKSTLGELPASLIGRILDSNPKLSQMALQICEALAVAMGAKCKNHVRTFYPAFFQAFGDNKQIVRSLAVSCITAWCNQAGPGSLLEGEMVNEALQGSPLAKLTLLPFLAEQLSLVPPKSFNREELLCCLPTLFASLEDRSVDVRKAANDCVLPFMLHLGYEAMFKQIDKLKPGSKSVVQGALEKARPNLPVQPLPTKKKEESKTVKSGGAAKKEAEKKAVPVKGKALAKSASATSRKKEEEDTTALLPNNNAKNQRIIDDQKLKVLKWNFVIPREEFFELLKEQMNNAGLNKQLVINMFHSDFRYHLKALESLSDDLQENGQSLVANLDLVLKWLTLRFFDTNPSVILKGLEYLSMVFNYLIITDYTMAEYEAHCFIPYLVNKVGDPKDSVRNGVKALFKQICVVYSVVKLFGYLMEGLKSKNARQRAECLECIGHLLETYGSQVMSNSITSSLKEMARHIGDRDNAVRSAALNCVANAYFLEGEKIYKMIGQISDKDLSLLEERIKRASKSRSAESRRSMLVPLAASGKPMQAVEDEPPKVISVDNNPGDEYAEEEEYECAQEEVPIPKALEPEVLSGPFGLDPELIAHLNAQAPVRKRVEVPTFDLKFLDEPIPEFNGAKLHCNAVVQRQQMPQMTPNRQHNMSMQPTPNKQSTLDDSIMADTIHSISSPDMNAAINALSLVSSVLMSGRGAAFGMYEDAFINSVAQQVKRLRCNSEPNYEAYKYLSGALTAFYDTANCGSRVSETSLQFLLSELLRVLGVQPTDKIVRILNNLCVKILDQSPRTDLLCAIISLLHESVSISDPSNLRYQNLVLKCFWKTLKMINSWEVDSIDYDLVMYKIHLFYKAYPNSFWKKQGMEEFETAYKTVKTLVHTLVRIKGTSIKNHLTKIPDINESELYPYLLKVFKQLKLDDTKENSVEVVNVNKSHQETEKRLPKDVHEQLGSILNRIGNKQHNKEALAQLYDLRERNPDVDIWAFMQNSSFYFRNYVERGLKQVAEQRRMGAIPMFKHDFNVDHIDVNNTGKDEQSHLVFLEKLRALQAKAGIKTDTLTSSQIRSPMSDNRLVDSINEGMQRSHNIDPHLELNSTQSIASRHEADVDALRLKLQQIKSCSKR